MVNMWRMGYENRDMLRGNDTPARGIMGLIQPRTNHVFRLSKTRGTCINSMFPTVLHKKESRFSKAELSKKRSFRKVTNDMNEIAKHEQNHSVLLNI